LDDFIVQSMLNHPNPAQLVRAQIKLLPVRPWVREMAPAKMLDIDTPLC